jgi:hypothetical protein
MADLDALLQEFKAGFEAGERPDLEALLERADPEQRQVLRERIDSYVMQAPRRAWDATAYASSPARESVERVWKSLEGVAGSWPELLPHLRRQAKLKRAELVERLAAALGFPTETERVAAYYHGMEHGQLRARGVSDRVLEALAGLLDTSRDALRAAGEGIGGIESEGGAGAFARAATPAPEYATPELEDLSSEAAAFTGAPAPGRKRDELDELFLGPAG